VISKKPSEKFKPYFAFKILVTVTLVGILFLFAYPLLAGKVRDFDADNYYQIVSGVIAGSVTLVGLAWQFAREHKRIHEESQQVQENSRIEARGIFEVYYSLPNMNTIHDEIGKVIAQSVKKMALTLGGALL